MAEHEQHDAHVEAAYEEAQARLRMHMDRWGFRLEGLGDRFRAALGFHEPGCPFRPDDAVALCSCANPPMNDGRIHVRFAGDGPGTE